MRGAYQVPRDAVGEEVHVGNAELGGLEGAEEGEEGLRRGAGEAGEADGLGDVVGGPGRVDCEEPSELGRAEMHALEEGEGGGEEASEGEEGVGGDVGELEWSGESGITRSWSRVEVSIWWIWR